VPTPLPTQNLFCPPILQFCRRKNIKDKMRNMTHLVYYFQIADFILFTYLFLQAAAAEFRACLIIR
jgi:hypothetical protein